MLSNLLIQLFKFRVKQPVTTRDSYITIAINYEQSLVKSLIVTGIIRLFHPNNVEMELHVIEHVMS